MAKPASKPRLQLPSTAVKEGALIKHAVDADASRRRGDQREPIAPQEKFKWHYQMPCSLSVVEPLLIVEPLARQLGSVKLRGTRQQLMAMDIADPIKEVAELFRVGNLLLRLVELLVAEEAGVVGVGAQRCRRELEERREAGGVFVKAFGGRSPARARARLECAIRSWLRVYKFTP